MNYNSKNLKFAKKMRSNMTDEESKLWYVLRGKRFFGFKFKRQVLLGDYIADFVCKDAKLVIEIDGGQHNDSEHIEYDKKRTEYINSLGYTVLRFWNIEVMDNFDGVCEIIRQHLFSEN